MAGGNSQGDLFATPPSLAPADRRQREQALAIGAPLSTHLRIVAGPGAGKTHVLSERVAHLVSEGVDPGRIAVVTYTNSARAELSDRLRRWPWWGDGAQAFVGTIHQFCGHLVRSDPGAAHLHRPPRMLDEQSIRRIFSIHPGEGSSPEPDSLDRWHLALNSWDGQGAHPLRAERRAWDRFDAALRERALASFVTIQLWALEVIEAGRVALPEQLLVDEFQDTSGLQVRVLGALAERGCWISVVGDPDQSIFRFAGGDPGQLPAFHERFRPCFSCQLAANGRSTEALVAFAGRLRRGGAQFSLGDRGQRPALWHLDGEAQQAEAVAGEIARLCTAPGGPARRPQDVAVLFREGAPASLVDALERLQIPFCLPGAERFEAREHVRALIVSLEWLADPEDEQAAFFFFDQVLRGGPKTWEQVLAARAEAGSLAAAAEAALARLARPRQATLRQWLACRDLLAELAAAFTPPDLVRALYEQVIAPRAGLRQRQRADEIEADLQRVTDLSRGCSGPAAVAALLRRGELPGDPAPDGVTLGTLHWAKGRQWPVVFLIDLTQGVLPHRRVEDVDEERRLLYVGISRAEERLILCAPERLPGRGEGASPFLDALADACLLRDLRRP